MGLPIKRYRIPSLERLDKQIARIELKQKQKIQCLVRMVVAQPIANLQSACGYFDRLEDVYGFRSAKKYPMHAYGSELASDRSDRDVLRFRINPLLRKRSLATRTCPFLETLR